MSVSICLCVYIYVYFIFMCVYNSTGLIISYIIGTSAYVQAIKLWHAIYMNLIESVIEIQYCTYFSWMCAMLYATLIARIQ